MQPIDSLRASKAFLSLSLNNQIANSWQALAWVLTWMQDHFETYDVVVGDYLQRHNEAIEAGQNDDRAMSNAVDRGRQMITAVERLLPKGSARGVKVIASSDLAKDVSFPERLRRLQAWNADSIGFGILTSTAVDYFLKRKHPAHMLDPVAREHSVSYQLEELALFEILVEAGYKVHIYPGTQLPILTAIVSGKVEVPQTPLHSLILGELRIY